MPTDGPLDPFGPDRLFPGSPFLEMWARPLRPLLPEVSATMRKPLAEVTMHELLACAVTFGYIIASVIVAEGMLLNLVRVAVRGR